MPSNILTANHGQGAFSRRRLAAVGSLGMLAATAQILAAEAVSQSPYSWRGIAGQGVFPAKDLVTSFAADAEGKGQNIVWRIPLPAWGANAPIVVKDKVFVMCQEGGAIEAPQLLCLDVNTGKLLWQQPVDHLDAWPEAKQKEAKEIRRKEFARWSDYMRWWNKLYWDNAKNTWKEGASCGKGELKTAPVPQAQSDLVAEALKAGWKMPPLWGKGVSGGYRSRYGLVEAVDEGLVKNFHRCIEENIYRYPGWASEGPFWGSVMGSVVSDGERIYAVTALDGAACYDLSGKRLWVTDLAAKLLPGMINSSAPAGKWPQTNMASPILAGGKLIYFHHDGACMYGLDCATGAIVWQTPVLMDDKRKRRSTRDPIPPLGYQGHMGPGGTPVAMVLGGTLVAISGNGMAVRVADGKYLGMVEKPAGGGDTTKTDDPEDQAFGASYNSWVADGDVLYAGNLGGDLAALRLRLDGDKVVTQARWTSKGLNGDPNLAFFNGRLYGATPKKKGLSEVDPATGQVTVSGPMASSWCTGWAISLDGVAVYKGGGGKGGGIGFAIVQLPGMKVLGQGTLDDTTTPEQRQHDLDLLGMGPANPGPAGTTAFGNRIFFRSNHYLWCIGNPAKPYEPVR